MGYTYCTPGSAHCQVIWCSDSQVQTGLSRRLNSKQWANLVVGVHGLHQRAQSPECEKASSFELRHMGTFSMCSIPAISCPGADGNSDLCYENYCFANEFALRWAKANWEERQRCQAVQAGSRAQTVDNSLAWKFQR